MSALGIMGFLLVATFMLVWGWKTIEPILKAIEDIINEIFKAF